MSKKYNETLNQFPDGSIIARRTYDVSGVTRVYEWSAPQSGEVTLSIDGADLVSVVSLFSGDTEEHSVTPITLSKVGFMDLAYVHLGVDLAGVARYGEILLQAKASISPLVVAAMERYAHASVFERGDVAIFLDILLGDVSVNVTLEERTAIIDGWPENGAA